MIRKLRFKFILLAAASLLVLMTVVVVSMNLINYHSVVKESDQLLMLLSQNNGVFPENSNHFGERFPKEFSPETPYESRYFTVVLSNTGKVIGVDTSKIIAIDKDTAVQYAIDIFQGSNEKGFVNRFRYLVYESTDGIRISFLDCGRSLDSFRNFFYTSIAVSLSGFIVIFAVIFIVSGKIVYPIAEAYRKQRQFITDAGHEIKTPLTIINANLDILEMELGEEQENIMEISNQTKRLRSLTEELVMLTRMEEAENSLEKIEFPLSDVIAEAAHPFYTLALNQEKELVCKIQPMLTLEGNDKAIRQLVALLLDNALKYSPSNKAITLTLEKKNKNIHLIVSNTTLMPIQPEQLTHVFDRFYRTDVSRNSETGGHGIGLSVAKAIVTAHNGTISAGTSDGWSFHITAVL